MKRREFVEKVGIGSAGIVAAATIGHGTRTSASEQHAHDGTQFDGPLANATVSFGQWLTTPAVDRFASGGNTRFENQHKMLPFNVTIKAGGSVSFIISGVHLLLVYEPGITKESIDETKIEFANLPAFPGFINDPFRRLYRGLDPRAPAPLDRVEVVTFAEPGRYFVICGLVPHFAADMSGWVNVLR